MLCRFWLHLFKQFFTLSKTVVTLLILVRLGRVAARWKAMSLKRPKMRSICEKQDLEVIKIVPESIYFSFYFRAENTSILGPTSVGKLSTKRLQIMFFAYRPHFWAFQTHSFPTRRHLLQSNKYEQSYNCLKKCDPNLHNIRFD